MAKVSQQGAAEVRCQRSGVVNKTNVKEGERWCFLFFYLCNPRIVYLNNSLEDCTNYHLHQLVQMAL